MTYVDGMTDQVLDCEGVSAMMAPLVSHADLLSTGLKPEDFYLRRCGEIWGEALSMPSPSPALLSVEVAPDWQRFYGRWAELVSPGSLKAHAAIVKRDSERRDALRELGKEAQRIHRGEVRGGVSLEYSE